jgi:hypothetical protein
MSPTEIVEGITTSERIVSPVWLPAGAVTVTVAVAVVGPRNPCALAEMEAVPPPIAVANPVALTETTDGELETQVTPLCTALLVR